MDRRAFITAISGTILATPWAGDAQPPKVPRIGFLSAGRQDLLIEAAMATRLPTMLTDRASVTGALAGMGENYYSIGRLSAKHVQRVLLGANPGDLPIEQLDHLNFVINLRTAQSLGLTIPQSLLIRADQIIR